MDLSPIPTPPPPTAMPADTSPATDKNWLGITALVTALVGMSLLAVIFGALGLRAAKAGRATNRGMALAGVILGAIGLAAAAAIAAVLIAGSMTAGRAATDEAAAEDAAALVSLAPSYMPPGSQVTFGYRYGPNAYVAVIGLDSEVVLPGSLTPGSGPLVSTSLNTQDTTDYCLWISYSGGTHRSVAYTTYGGASWDTQCPEGYERIENYR